MTSAPGRCSSRIRTCGFLWALLLGAAGPSVLGRPAPPPGDWDAKIRPLLSRYCQSCHGGQNPQGGLRLDRFENALRGSDSGRVMIAGNSAGSRLIQRLSLPPDHPETMPPKGLPRPTAEQIALLADWIDRASSWPEPADLSAEKASEPAIPYVEFQGPASELKFKEHIHPFLKHYCYGCHDNATREGGLDLQESVEMRFDDELRKWHKTWGNVTRAITTGSMPHPAQKHQPSERERELFARWYERALEERVTPESSRASNARLRQLTPYEYDNTVRDLTGLDLDLSRLTQPGGVASDGGFANRGHEMQLSPTKLTRYMQAGDRIASHAILDPDQGLRFGPPGSFATPDPLPADAWRTRALHHLLAFAERAYRRPMRELEVRGLTVFLDNRIREGMDRQTAARKVVQGILASPQFVYLAEEHGWERKQINWSDKKRKASKATGPLGHHAVASRLSYFIWSGPPDWELFRLALEERLHDRQILENQVKRMLRDPRAAALATQFVGQWLRFNKVRDHLNVSRDQFPSFSESLQGAMYGEIRSFVEEIIRQDLSILNLLDSDFTYVNGELAGFYGMKGIEGDAFRKVSLSESDGRGGLLGMAGILSLTSHPNRRSAIERGAYILDEILGTPTLPPPVETGKLEDSQDRDGSELSLREVMARHRQDLRCAGCHNRIDPLGLALEEFDAIGRRRQDPVSDPEPLPDGTLVRGLQDLKRYLLQEHRRRTFVRNFAENLVVYALTRELQSGDFYTVLSVRRALEENDYRISAAVAAVATSDVFLRRSEE